jgi:HlyD family secretion protein
LVPKRRKLAVVLVVVVVLAAAGGYAWRTFYQQEPSNRLTLYGNVDIREVQLAFNGEEHIAELRVREGDRVAKGQVLARLDPQRLEAQVADAAYRVEAQRQVLAALEAGSRPQEIREAEARLRSAEADSRAKQLTYKRLQKLLPKKLVSPEQVDAAQAAAEAAEAQVCAARAVYDLAVAGPRKEDIAAAAAELKAREAELTLARERLADATLYAPADGIIRDRILEPGDFATPQTPVYTLALLDPLWVRAYIPEPDLGKVAPGMRAQVTTDSYPGKIYRGWVGYISPTAEFTPKIVQTLELRTRLVYQARIFVCDPQNELRLGMPATVSIPFDQPRSGGGEDDPCKDP